jgi:hypothetical protein
VRPASRPVDAPKARSVVGQVANLRPIVNRPFAFLRTSIEAIITGHYRAPQMLLTRELTTAQAHNNPGDSKCAVPAPPPLP